MFYRLFPINGEDILNATCFSDEAWLDLSGHVNSQHPLVVCFFNENEFIEAPLNDQKVGVWCEISRSRVIGPMFNSDRYCQLTVYPFIGYLNEDDIASRYFQQDDAITYTAHFSFALQCVVFREQLISVHFGHRGRPISVLILVFEEQRKL
jgi:hypothetical protein